MPLLDHFRPPLSGRRYGHALLSSWAIYLSSGFNALPPVGYLAEANVQYGVEIDVAALRESTGVQATEWAPPPHASVPVEFPGAVGRHIQPLPTLPLWLRGGLCRPVELEDTYTRTCVEQRVPPAA